MEQLAIILAIIASIIDVGGSVLYIKAVLADPAHPPSKISWGIWSFLAILSSCSFTIMTGDLIKAILPIVSTTACVGIFFFILFKSNAKKLQKFDYWALAIGIFAAFVWWIYKNATYGNLLLQPSFIIGYIPTYINVWKDSKSEKPLPWLVWTAMFLMQITVVLLRWKGQYQDIVASISGLIFCAIVPILTLRKTQNPR